MDSNIQIAKGEHGVLRLFAVEHPDTGSSNDHAGQRYLGVEDVDENRIEVFDVGDLAGMPLSRYLTEGVGVAERDLGVDRARIDALDGTVMIVHPGAFKEREATIRPGDGVKLIATYRDAPVAAPMGKLRSDGAAGVMQGGAGPGPAVSRGIPGGWVWGVIGVVALLIVIVLAR